MTCVLALDVGTTMARAVLYDGRADPVPGGEARRLHGGLTDADALADAVAELAAEARRAGEPDAVATSCFWHSLVALDGRGRPLTPILGWRGAGAADDADSLAARVDAEAAYARTGCPLHPAYWPAKVAWLRRTDPDVFSRARRLVSFGEYLYVRLTGETAPPASLSMASGTGLLQLETRVWDEELLGALALDHERLPAVGDEPVGADVPWFPPLGDGACSNVGVGAVTPDRAAVTVGTSAALRTVSADDGRFPRRGLFLYRLDRARLVEGGALSDGGNLLYLLRDLLRLDDVDPLAGREPDGHGLTFLALLGGERSPGWDARARGAVAGLSFDTTALDVLQAALEGVALRLAEVAELMPGLRELVLTGGAMARLPSWAQALADATGLPVVRSPVGEGSARGAAVTALERLGAEPADAPLADDRLEPRPEAVAAYRAARERQQALQAALRDVGTAGRGRSAPGSGAPTRP